MKSYILIFVFFIFLNSCTSENHKNEIVPDAINDIIEISKISPSNLSLQLEIDHLGSDSISVDTYLKNTDGYETDTLYHSSSFPLHIAYINDVELTPPLESQVFFDDLNMLVIESNSTDLIQSFRARKITDSEYKLIALFRFSVENPGTSQAENYWLVSNIVSVE